MRIGIALVLAGAMLGVLSLSGCGKPDFSNTGDAPKAANRPAPDGAKKLTAGQTQGRMAPKPQSAP